MKPSIKEYRHRRRINWLLPGLLCLFLLVNPRLSLAGSESEVGEKETEHHNKVALFVGNTQDGGDHGASVGLTYEYRLAEHYGVGAWGEYAGGDFDSWLVGVPLFIHPYAGWFFVLAPALEFHESETHFIGRIGGGYDFEIAPGWALAPEFYLDLNRREREFTQVYGVSVSYEF